MKKNITTLLLTLLTTPLFSETYHSKNTIFRIENDADIRTDMAYTYGADLSFLFKREDVKDTHLAIPFVKNFSQSDKYISFSYAQQMYTPKEIKESELIEDDRPYAGYMYLQTGLYQSFNNVLDSLVFQVGLVGPCVQMDNIQSVIHNVLGSEHPQGWDHQIKNELILQVNYSHKQLYNLDQKIASNTALITNYGFELGNASTKLFSGAMFRYGYDALKDYGSFVMDNTNYSHIPVKNVIYTNDDTLHFSFHLMIQADIVARNIFLDGNTFRDSHSVDKNIFLLEGSYGISLFYNQWSFDYVRKHKTKEFKKQYYDTSYGSVLLSYHY